MYAIIKVHLCSDVAHAQVERVGKVSVSCDVTQGGVYRYLTPVDITDGENGIFRLVFELIAQAVSLGITVIQVIS